FFFQAEDGIRDATVTGVQTCALPIYRDLGAPLAAAAHGDVGGAVLYVEQVDIPPVRRDGRVDLVVEDCLHPAGDRVGPALVGIVNAECATQPRVVVGDGGPIQVGGADGIHQHAQPVQVDRELAGWSVVRVDQVQLVDKAAAAPPGDGDVQTGVGMARTLAHRADLVPGIRRHRQGRFLHWLILERDGPRAPPGADPDLSDG